MLRALGLLLLIAIGLQAQAQAPVTVAEQLLKEDLALAVKSVSSDVRIYNYFNIPQAYEQLQNSTGRADYANRYFQAVGSRFWDINYVTDSFINAGPGVYAAIDPLISQEYGNAMLEITLSTGTKYLNVVKQVPVRNETLAALIAEGALDGNSAIVLFGSQVSPKFSRDTLKNMTSLQHVRFRQLVQKIFFDSGISVIEYNWDTELPRQVCPRHGYSAFVLVGRPQILGDVQSITDSAKKVLTVPNLNLQALTIEELESQHRAISFRGFLAEIKTMKSLGTKVDAEAIKKLVSNFFIDQASYLDVLNKTFSCQEVGLQ